MKILLVGFGSPHGDDQIGWLVCEKLAEQTKDIDSLCCFQSRGSGIDWIGALSNVTRVIFVDGVKSGVELGTIFTFDDFDKYKSIRASITSSHRVSLLESIELAKALNIFNVSYTIYAIEICNIQAFSPMNIIVEQAGNKLVTQLLHELINPEFACNVVSN